MKPPSNSANIPVCLSRITRSVFSFKKHTRGRTASSGLSRFNAPTISVAIGALLVSLALSGSMFWRGGSVGAFTEVISTFQSDDCTTPKTAWDLGQTACAGVTGAGGTRRIVWVAPDGTVADVSASFSGSGSDTYAFLASGPFAQYGTWKVLSIDNAGNGYASASFLVSPANTLSVDLVINKFGPDGAIAGSGISYRIEIVNRGPDTAQSVVLTEAVPNDSTFASEAQNSGPSATCSNPGGGATGTSTCTIPTLAPNESATFTFVYNVNAGTPVDTLIINTASVSSSTNELFAGDNSATSQTGVVPGASTPACTINCPADIIVNNNAGDANPCVKAVSYTTPTASGSCADPDTGLTPPVVCSPPSGSEFPVGTSSVVCSAGGTACSFTITVSETRALVQPTITCPSDVTASESDPGSGSAIVNYPAPTTTGNCVVVVCNPQSGSSFNVGTTTVTCSGTDSANTTVTCTFNVTVVSGNCTLTCPGDVTQTAPSNQCTTVVNYADPTTNGTCGTVTCNPPSGSTFPTGTTAVTCTSSAGASCDFTVTINAPAAPTITTCASNKAVPSDSNCEGVMPNLLGEVVATGCNVTLSQSPAAGSAVPAGIYTVVITAENSAGQATCTATVTVDTQAPVINTCPAPTNASADSNCQAAVPNVTGAVVAADNCTPAGSLAITQNPAAGTLVGPGQTTITITVKDQSNNAITCMTTLTVNDTTPPTISCPANISVTAAIGQPSAVVTFSPTVTDNCTGASFVCLPPSGSAFQLGRTTVSCTATDLSGNQANCTFKVAVSGTLFATADSFVRDGADNTNEGGNDLLRIQSSGHNRVLARFNTSGISTTGLQSATLLLSIAENSDNWGTTGRLVDAHRLLADWTEGNGHTVGSQPNFRGTGEGVTWNCAKDANISNQNDDCTSQWDGGTFAAATAASVLHTNNQMGDVSWIVTADVLAGANNGWVIKKQTEGQNGQVKYYSKEGAVSAGNQNLGPRLVLVFQP